MLIRIDPCVSLEMKLFVGFLYCWYFPGSVNFIYFCSVNPHLVITLIMAAALDMNFEEAIPALVPVRRDSDSSSSSFSNSGYVAEILVILICKAYP